MLLNFSAFSFSLVGFNFSKLFIPSIVGVSAITSSIIMINNNSLLFGKLSSIFMPVKEFLEPQLENFLSFFKLF